MFIKMSRPRFWLYTAGPFLVGALFANPLNVLTLAFWLQFLFFLIPANMYLYGINDFYDEDTDKYNSKKNQRETKKTHSHATYIFISIILFIIYAAFLSKTFFIYLGLFFLLSTFYSADPIRFKKRPIVDSLSNVLYVIPGFMSYHMYSGEIVSVSIILAAWFWTAAMHLYSAIPDITADSKADLLTTAIFFGKNRSLILCTLLWGLSVLLSQFWIGIIYPLLSLITFKLDIQKLYWIFPYVNGIFGALLSGYALWLMLY